MRKDFTFRDIKSINGTTLKDYLRDCDWSVITSQEDFAVRAGLICLYGNLDTALEALAPVKTFGDERNLLVPSFVIFSTNLLQHPTSVVPANGCS